MSEHSDKKGVVMPRKKKSIVEEISKYYSLKKILEEGATYNVIIGERSNGKTYAVLKEELVDFITSGYKNQGAIIRRYGDDFKGARGSQMWEALVQNGEVSKLTNGEWTNIIYRASRWYLAKFDEKLDKWITMQTPLAFGFALSGGEHDKSTSYPNIKTILFDEFLTRGTYYNDEFVMFMNVLSTIIRDRDDVRIFMCANTVNKYAPYFSEMGLTHIEEMNQGDIDVYTYGDSKLKVAVEYCKTNKQGKKSDKYFAFDNPKLNMITSGAWEIDIYPHLPYKYEKKNIKAMYFIQFNKALLQCEIVKIKAEGKINLFTFIHKKTSPLKDFKKDRIYSTIHTSKPNYRRNILKPQDELDKFYLDFFKEDRVFYQDNELGEVVRNYFNWCKEDKGAIL